MTRSTRYTGYASALVLTCAAFAGNTHAQVIERHLPPATEGKSMPIAAPNAIPSDQDATPIGPALKAIILLGNDDPVSSGDAGGISISGTTRLKAYRGVTEADLRPFLGQTLSRKLIAQIEARLARRYRKIGYPFVSLMTPEQQISGGVLQVRIVEFHAGAVAAPGVSPGVAAGLISHVRLKSGDAINADALSDDLNWLNRYPFRQVQAVFKPGQAPATSDLILATNSGRPWQLYAGYANDGSPATGMDRFYVGGALGNVLGTDSVTSFQATGSRDAFGAHPAYGSQALTYTLPVGLHGQVETSVDRIETNQISQPFSIRLNVNEGSLDYRFGLQSTPAAQTDMAVGITAKHQDGTTLFDGTKVYDVAVEDYQVFIDLHHKHDSTALLSTLDATLHLSPGDIDAGNSAAQTVLYSQGRLKSARYAYLNVSYNALVPLPGDFAYGAKLYWQFATQALPRTEQAGLGGDDLVRGYSLDDGAFDTALVVRNELRTPLKFVGQVQISPYLFVDAGSGRDLYLKTNTDLMSTGAGADVTLSRAATLRLSTAYDIKESVAIKSGDWKVQAALNYTF